MWHRFYSTVARGENTSSLRMTIVIVDYQNELLVEGYWHNTKPLSVINEVISEVNNVLRGQLDFKLMVDYKRNP